MALSRRPACKNKKNDYRNIPDLCLTYVGSHDAFAFAPPVDKQITKMLDHTQNQGLGAENKVVWEFKNAGFKVLNPCTNTYAYHLHCSGERHYDALDKKHKWKVISDAKYNKGVTKFGTAKPNQFRFPPDSEKNCPTQVY